MPYTRLSLVLAALIGAQALPAGEHNAPPAQPPPHDLFKAFDTDGNHSVSREEFGAGLRELAQRHQENRPGDGADRPRPPGGGDGADRPRPPGGGDGADRPRPPGDGDHGDRPQRPPGGDRPQPPAGGPRPQHPPGGDGEAPRHPTPPGDGPQTPPDPAERERHITEAFKAGDADKDGALSPPEFKTAMEALPKPPHPPQGPPPRK